MTSKKDISHLEEFRGLIDKYLFLGYAPGNFGDKEKMNQALKDPSFAELRRKINEKKPIIIQILSKCRLTTIITEIPSRAIGGPILKYDLINLITENQIDEDIEKQKFFDTIDQAIGLLKTCSEDEIKNPIIQTSPNIQKGFVFIAMPMDSAKPESEDVLEAIKTAASELGLIAERIDEPQSNERITDRIIESINKAEFVVCDLTLSKQNVYYEAGYAHGVGKIPIYIAKYGTNLEFDLKDYPVIFFHNLKELKEKLLKRLKGLMKK